MERSRKPKKRKFGTTILEQTDDNISMFKEQHPQEFKTPGKWSTFSRASVSASTRAQLRN